MVSVAKFDHSGVHRRLQHIPRLLDGGGLHSLSLQVIRKPVKTLSKRKVTLNTFRSLRCLRNTVHLNLFAAMILHNIHFLFWYLLIIYPSKDTPIKDWSVSLH